MIFDELENLAHYKSIHNHLDCAIDYLLTHDLSNYELGRYELMETKFSSLCRKMSLIKKRMMALNFIIVIWICIFSWKGEK